MRKWISAGFALLLGAGASLAQGPAPVVSLPEPAAPAPVESTPAFPDAGHGGCPSGPRVWARADYLLWWIKDARFSQPVATTGPFDRNQLANDVLNAIDPNTGLLGPLPVRPAPGGVGTPGTQALFGGHGARFGSLSGMRLSLGGTFDSDGIFGVEGSGFALEKGSVRFRAATDATGSPLLTRPFFDVALNRQAVITIGEQSDDFGIIGGFTGSMQDQLTTRLWGYEANFSAVLLSTPAYRFTALAGFRYMDLQEKLSMASFSQPTVLAFPSALGPFQAEIGDTLGVFDQFGTRSQFYGGQVGGRFEYNTEWVSVGGTAKVAVGSTHQKVSVNGLSTLNGSIVGFQSIPGGLYAQPSNSGTRTANDLTWVPELGVDLGFNLTSWARVSVGYTFLYWSRVLRAADQVNPVGDRRQIPTSGFYDPTSTTSNPTPFMNRSDFWAQGLSLGLQIQF
jgi:hypothetical protein